MKEVNTVLFDIDGTLVQSWDLIISSFSHVLNHFHLPLDGLSNPMMRHCTLKQGYKFLGLECHMEEALQLHVKFQKENMHLLKLCPGAHETLRALSGRNRATISNRIINGPHFLSHFGLLDHLDLTIGADHLMQGKPHPEGLMHALEYFQTEPWKTVIVGDTVADVRAGKSIGAWTVAVDGSSCLDELKKSRPDYLIGDLIELIPLLS